MKICIITNVYPPYARGGAEQVVVKTVEGLLAAGHDVVVVTAAPQGQHVWREGRLTIYRLHPFNVFFYTDAHRHGVLVRAFWHLLDMFHVGSAKYVRRVLETEKPMVVHTHNLMGLGFLIPRVIRRLGIRHIHTVHDVQLAEPSGVILKKQAHGFRYRGWPSQIYCAIMKYLVG